MFVTFEGPEGGGKSTLILAVAEALREEGIEIITTREPGSGRVGSQIREILLTGEELDSRSELFLFLADRAQHVSRLISPNLTAGRWVLCDRFADSTIVYQGYGRGHDLESLKSWNEFATGGLKPDLTFLLDLSPEVGLSRIRNKDRLDREPLAFHNRVREGFLAESKLDPDRWVILDASQSTGFVLERAMQVLRTRLPASRQ